MSLTLFEGMVIGGAGGTIAGLTIWFIKLLKDYVMKQVDKKTVMRYLIKITKLHNEHKVTKPSQYFVSTTDLAGGINLTQDRIRYICSIHEKIEPLVSLFNESWALRDWRNKDLEEK